MREKRLLVREPLRIAFVHFGVDIVSLAFGQLQLGLCERQKRLAYGGRR
jgi:hypothetical protein